MQIVTNEQLNEQSQRVVSYYKGNDLQLFTLFSLLYITGVRINEAINLDLWQLETPDIVKLNGLKGANPRYFNLLGLPTEFQKYFTENYNIFQFISYTNLVRYLNRALKFKLFYNSGKAINFHMFRHNYIRKLYTQTNNIEFILNDLGKTKNSDITTYLLTNLYKN